MSRAPRPAGTIPNFWPSFKQPIPHRQRVLPLEEQLEAVLPGVAGARDERRLATGMALGDGVVAQAAQVHVGQRLEQLRGARTLDGDERGAQRGVVDGGVVAGEAGVQLARDLLAV